MAVTRARSALQPSIFTSTVRPSRATTWSTGPDAETAGRSRRAGERDRSAYAGPRRSRFLRALQTDGAAAIVAKLEEAVHRRTKGEHTLATFKAPDAQRQGWIKALLAGQLPKFEDLRLEHRLFAGITAWSSLNIFNAGSSAVYFVGDREAIAENVKAYHDCAGLSALILCSWPLIESSALAGRHRPSIFSLSDWSNIMRTKRDYCIQQTRHAKICYSR